MNTIYPLSNDIIFCSIFGDERYIHLLNYMLLVLFGENDDPVVRIMNPISIPELVKGKKMIFDIKCQTQSGNIICIEMQNKRVQGFEKRHMLYGADSLRGQLKKGEDYTALRKVLNIAILNFRRSNKCLYDIEQLVKEDGEIYSDILKYKVIELPNYIDNANVVTNECSEFYYLWKMLIAKKIKTNQTVIEYYQDIVKELKAKGYSLMVEIVELNLKMNSSEEVRKMILAEELRDMDSRNIGFHKGLKKGIKQGISQGISQGVKQGISQGISQGIKQGLKQGIKQGIDKNKQEIARKLHTIGMSINSISDITGLTVEEVENICSTLVIQK